MNIPEYWWPFLYQCGVGLVIFLVGLWLFLRHKSCVLSRKQDRFGLGTFFGRYARSTRGFFFGGQKSSWWLIAMSLVTTGREQCCVSQ